MPEPELERSVPGSCLCGRVRFAVALPTLFCAHCHCTMCQRNHGAGYVTWFGVPKGQLRVLEGESSLVAYRSSQHGKRSFCRDCGSSLFCENALHAERVDVVLASMQGAIDRAPQLHTYIDSKADWIELADDLPRLGGESGTEAK